MSVSFIRIDDRMIHGQTCTRPIKLPVERKHLSGL